MPAPRTRARISNNELSFLEDQIAYALSIIQSVKALAYWIDDPEQLGICIHILADAQAIRQRSMQHRDDGKAASVECRGDSRRGEAAGGPLSHE